MAPAGCEPNPSNGCACASTDPVLSYKHIRDTTQTGNPAAPVIICRVMRKRLGKFFFALVVLCLSASLWAFASQIDDDLTATRRVFPGFGPGLRALRHGQNGKYYLLAAPNTGVAVFDSQGKPLAVIGAAPSDSPRGGSAISFAEDCDVDAEGNLYVADRAANLVSAFSPNGKPLRSMSVAGPLSVAALPEGEVAVTALKQTHLVTVFGPNGRVVREFGDSEALSVRDDVNTYLSRGRVASDAQGRIYYGFTYMPEPLVRQYDRAGYAGQDFQFTGLDAFSEAQALRKEIERQEKRSAAPSFRQVLTAFGVDPRNGEVWMSLHNTLLHFDKDGNRRSEYQIYTREGARLEATVLLVEPDRLLIGSDPLGVYEFPRPDQKH